MNIDTKQNFPLAPLTTFKIGGPAKEFIEITDRELVSPAVDYAVQKRLNLLILGGGSNVLISDSGFEGLVIHLLNKGVEKLEETSESVKLKIASGENWDKFVAFCCQNNWWGVENLSHIPGLSGSIAVQNVGAYGQEASQVIEYVEAFDVEEKKYVKLNNSECGFSYRKSIFNSKEKGRYIILETVINLSKKPSPNTKYADVEKYFLEKNISTPSIDEIRQAIISIRNRKYPFPTEAVGGNAGSFFKNSTLNEQEYDELHKNILKNFTVVEMERLEKYRSRATDSTKIKIPSAYLIEICGLKNTQIGGAKINENQPLVILNDGTATAKDVLNLFKKVREEVQNKTGIKLLNEPELIGFTKEELENYLSI